MTGLGTLVNMAAILIGSGPGTFIKKWYSKAAADYYFQRSWPLFDLCRHYRGYQGSDECIGNYL